MFTKEELQVLSKCGGRRDCTGCEMQNDDRCKVGVHWLVSSIADQCIAEMERAETAERRAEVAEKALGLACKEIETNCPVASMCENEIPCSECLENNFKLSAEQALKEGKSCEK